jgi:hypothetical protein
MEQLSFLEAPPRQNDPDVWNTLDEEQRMLVVTRLAWLIAKTVADTEPENHDD